MKIEMVLFAKKLNLIQRRMLRIWRENVYIFLIAFCVVGVAYLVDLIQLDLQWMATAVFWVFFWIAVIYLLMISPHNKESKKGDKHFFRKMMMGLYWAEMVGFVSFFYLALHYYRPLAFLIVLPLGMRAAEYYSAKDHLWAYAILLLTLVLFRLSFQGHSMTSRDFLYEGFALVLFAILTAFMVYNVKRLERMRQKREELFRVSSRRSSELRRANHLLAEAYDKLAYHHADTGKLNEMLSQAYDELSQRNAIMERDLELAAHIQKRLITEKMPVMETIHLEARFLPFDKVGGDLYFVERKGNFLWVFMTDVSGHGMPAALVAAMCHGSLNHFLHEREESPANVLQKMNDDLAPYLSGFYFTGFLARIPIYENTIKICVAGHPYPLLIQRGRNSESISCPNPILGIFPDLDIQELEKTFDKGDRLFVFTDGIYESKNLSGEILGYKPLAHFLSRDPEKSIADIADDALRFANSFAEGCKREDDLTFLAMERL